MESKFKIMLFLAGILLVTGCSNQGNIRLVKNGETEYSIFLDPSSSESVMIAAEDLKMYFNKVTGASPEIIVSNEIPATPFISLGITAACRDAGLNAEGIESDGFRMVTMDGNLLIYGPDTPTGEVNSKGGVNNGTSNGIYTFIEEYLGVMWLMPGELGEEYDEKGNISIPELDRTESSPFEYRVVAYRENGTLEEEWNRRMKLGEVAAVEFNHSWLETVPPSLFDKHPDWFAMANGKRVPPIGKYYKLESTNPELVQYFADKVIEAFRKDPQRKWHSLSPSDGGGFSDSPESMALVEKDRWGNDSRTPLVLTFYNEVAKIVGKEFPDHMLGGLLYGNIGGYRCPPSSGLKIEPNLVLMIPNGPCYGFRLYRDFAQDNWADSIYIPEWSALSKEYGFDIYYNDYLITLIPSNGIILPAAPYLLNLTFSGLDKYGFKGADIAGNPIRPVSGPGNYTLARLFWNPKEDSYSIQHDYYQAAYGAKAGGYIEILYNRLDTAFAGYYAKDHRIAWNLVESHHKGIYGPNYPEMENLYLQALSARKSPRQQERLELFGQVLSMLQWTLRGYGYLPADYSSTLTLSDDEIDNLLENQREDCRITKSINYKPKKLKVEIMPALADAVTQKSGPLPVARSATMVLQPLASGEVTVTAAAFNIMGEFIQYVLTDASGQQMQTGAIAEGRTISFQAEAGRTYYLLVPNRKAFGKLKIEGAAVAYSIPKRGIQLQGSMMDASMSLYFYVPAEMKGFTLIMGNKGAVADVYSPDGRKAGQLNNLKSAASTVQISEYNTEEGFWKLVLKKSDVNAIITLDEKLPQWVTPDPAHPLRVLSL